MENQERGKTTQKAKAPLADEKHKLNPSVTGKPKLDEEKEPGKLPENEFGIDHNSDPVIAKKQ